MGCTVGEISNVGDHVRQQSGEAFQRAAIGRYYYAAYTLSLQLSKQITRPKKLRSAGVHKALTQSLLSYDGVEKELIHEIVAHLSSLKNLRTIADYKTYREIFEIDVETAKWRSDEILNLWATAAVRLNFPQNAHTGFAEPAP